MLPSLQMLQQLEQVEPEREELKRELETLSEARQILCRLQLDSAFCSPAADKLCNAMRSLRARQDEIFNQLTK